MREYFKTRRGWKIETEKRLADQRKIDGEYYSKILEQRVRMAEYTVSTELNAEIDRLERKVDEKNAYIMKLKKKDHEVEKLKNELSAKTQHLDYQNSMLGEIQSRIAVQMGLSDSIIRDSEKLLIKEV